MGVALGPGPVVVVAVEFLRYILRRFPPPQYSDELPAQVMVHPLSVAGIDPAERAFPQ